MVQVIARKNKINTSEESPTLPYFPISCQGLLNTLRKETINYNILPFSFIYIYIYIYIYYIYVTLLINHKSSFTVKDDRKQTIQVSSFA